MFYTYNIIQELSSSLEKMGIAKIESASTINLEPFYLTCNSRKQDLENQFIKDLRRVFPTCEISIFNVLLKLEDNEAQGASYFKMRVKITENKNQIVLIAELLFFINRIVLRFNDPSDLKLTFSEGVMSILNKFNKLRDYNYNIELSKLEP